ncbi:M14 family metallocarboxypeptidase [uncultured Deefgea sp.]|uniref:M14 family metallopeptidase n=1 Tax=uncultured Deefgea sp. TaxID=1304914 RepID=UPI002637B701|nr:M14 family metallocarboxypeptidase [uncultured Deefgea sp.]
MTKSSTVNQPIYPIGTLGIAWQAKEKADWLAIQQRKRNYWDEVVSPLTALLLDRDSPLADWAELVEYAVLDYQPQGLAQYPLFAVRSRDWQAHRPTVLVTGGVHGYETSGVQGALQFIAQKLSHYQAGVNLLILPCISPWAYETINRWNPLAIDPNRAFVEHSPAAESAAAMAFIRAQTQKVALHIDLHETTDTDNSEFGPAKAARDGVAFEYHDIPDGFYLVGDSENPQPEFQGALISAVSQVTHIAVADAAGCLIGEPLQQLGVINYAKKALGLCGGMTDAMYVTTTEVYPDSPKASAEQCNRAQVVTICAAIDYVLQHENK